jgi:hypothetical protein
MTYGPDGNLYVSQWGFGAAAGGGENRESNLVINTNIFRF